MGPPATDRVTKCALVATKVTERYGLTDSERDCLLPSMRSWDSETLATTFCWEHDKLGLLGTDPVFHEFRLIEDGSEVSFRYKTLFLQPDEETLYAMVTNDVDSGALLVYQQDDWFVMAAFGLYKLMDHLKERGFTSWDDLKVQSQAQQNSDSDVSDYWNQYGDQDHQIEDEPEPAKKPDTKLFIQGHVQRAIKDLYKLYNVSTEAFAAEILGVVGHSRSRPVQSSELTVYATSLLENCFQLYQQIDFDQDRLVDDIKLALLELDFMVLNKLGLSD